MENGECRCSDSDEREVGQRVLCSPVVSAVCCGYVSWCFPCGVALLDRPLLLLAITRRLVHNCYLLFQEHNVLKTNYILYHLWVVLFFF